jgi:hypothetical protein
MLETSLPLRVEIEGMSRGFTPQNECAGMFSLGEGPCQLTAEASNGLWSENDLGRSATGAGGPAACKSRFDPGNLVPDRVANHSSWVEIGEVKPLHLVAKPAHPRYRV